MSNLKLNSSPQDLVKELAGGHSFVLTERVEGEYRGINTPKLLTAIMAPTINTHRTRAFIYDVENKTAQLPVGKSYSEKGANQQKDSHNQIGLTIPSFGTTYQVLPQDYDGKRKPNSSEFMTEAYVVERQQETALAGMDLLNEIGMAELLVNDRNYLSGGPFTQYNYSEVNGITGGRAAPTAIDFAASDSFNVRRQVTRLRKVLEQRLGEAGKDAEGFMLICGDNAFDRFSESEAQLGLARALMSELDLASLRIPVTTEGVNSTQFRYDNFKSEAGVTVVNYGSTILNGGTVIGDDDAYLIPYGVSNMITIELAPAMVRGIVNEEAEAMYVFTEAGLRSGVTTEIETNRLFLNRNPELITAITTSQ